MKTNKQVLEEVRTKFETGNFDGMLQLFDVNCVVRQAPCLPFGGDWFGHDGVVAFWARQSELMEIAPTFLGLYEIDVSRFLVHASLQMTSRASGATETTQVLEIFTVRNGLITEALPFYWNSDAVTRAVT